MRTNVCVVTRSQLPFEEISIAEVGGPDNCCYQFQLGLISGQTFYFIGVIIITHSGYTITNYKLLK